MSFFGITGGEVGIGVVGDEVGIGDIVGDIVTGAPVIVGDVVAGAELDGEIDGICVTPTVGLNVISVQQQSSFK